LKIILDNIIFQLQASGGISNYWYQLIDFFYKNKNDIAFFDDKPTENLFRDLLPFNEIEDMGRQDLPFGRYINPRFQNHNEKAIFHSSYYRTSLNKNHINITTVHDFTYEHFIKSVKGKAHKVQKKHAILNSQGIICISENTKKDLLKFIPEAKKITIDVIPHGVSSNDFKILGHNDEEIRPTVFTDNEFLLYVGDRKASYKNFDKAVKTAKVTGRPLIILGGGALKKSEITLLERLVSNRYEHFGKVDTKTLNWFYNKAFALIYPSAYEGFGLPVIEAQLAGCPVVALNASSIPDVAGKAAILVEENNYESFVDAIEQLKNQSLREKLIEKGLVNAKNFTWENTFKKTLSFYQKMYHGQ